MHIPDDPQYYEKFYFTPGDLGFRSFKTSKGNLGTLICWDQWFPEATRLTALKGQDNFLPNRDRLASKRKRNLVRLNLTLGYRSKRHTPLQMEYMWLQ